MEACEIVMKQVGHNNEIQKMLGASLIEILGKEAELIGWENTSIETIYLFEEKYKIEQVIELLKQFKVYISSEYITDRIINHGTSTLPKYLNHILNKTGHRQYEELVKLINDTYMSNVDTDFILDKINERGGYDKLTSLEQRALTQLA